MVNKKILGTCMLALLLTGCSSNTSSTNKSTTSKSNSSKMVSSKTSPKVDESSKSSQEDSKSEEKKPTDYFVSNNDFLKTEIKPFYLPSKNFVSTGQAVNLHATVNNQIKTAIYSISDRQKKPDNNLTLEESETLFAKYEEQSFSMDEIRNQINWIPEQQGLPTVDLGFNIKATSEGAAGSTYLTWHEGKWSLTIRSSNLNSNSNQQALELARKMVAYFENNALPAPETVGSVLINFESNDNKKILIKWDHSATLISISGPDVFTVLNYATSLK